MRRRGNKSTKVPNVKLRPAEPIQRTRELRSPDVWAQDSQRASDDPSIIDTCPRPFSGLVLCATGVMDKPGLFRQAVELGATTCNAFTDRVTHLIANDHGGAKYLCALERKIPILAPEWITENYQIWLKGDDVDINESLEKHRLPIFSGVVLCLSGVDDIKRRTKINRCVSHHGGSYVKQIERPVRVTHLLCSGEEVTDKMRYAEKFNRNREANIKLVWEEWFWDSLDYGGRFDENKYQARQPRPKPRQSAVEVPALTSTLSSSAILEEESVPRQQQEQESKVDDEEEPAAIQRIPAVQLQLWASLLKPRGYEIDHEQGRLVRSPTKSQSRVQAREDSEDEDMGPALPIGGSKSFLSSAGFRRANSFAPVTSKPIRRIISKRPGSQPEDGEERGQDLQRDLDTPGAGPSIPRSSRASPLGNVVSAPDIGMNAPEIDEPAPVAGPTSPPKIFGGRKFLLLGEADSPRVRDEIQRSGGEFVDGTEAWAERYETEVDFVIVRLFGGSSIFCNLPPSASTTYRAKFRTECWLEQCFYDEKICPPERHVTFTPVGFTCPIEGAETVSITFSGLEDSERTFMPRFAKTLGFTVLSNFSKRTTHLFCPSGEGPKYDKAKEWGTPVFNTAWVAKLRETGRIPEIDEAYLVAGQDINKLRLERKAVTTTNAGEISNVVHRESKGKGREITPNEPKMADITNSQSQTPEGSEPTFEFVPQVTSTQKHPANESPPIPSLSNLKLSSPAGSFGNPTLLCNPVPQETSTSNIPTDGQQPPDISSALVNKGKGKEKDPGPATPVAQRHHNHNETADTNMGMASVPSSRTPSPVKMTSHGTHMKRKLSNSNMKGRSKAGLSRKKSGSLSPSKHGYHHAQVPMEIDGERARALQESVANLLNGNPGGGQLLGKRRSEEIEAEGNLTGKRQRPIRSKGRLRAQQPQTVEPYQPEQDEELNREFGGHALEQEHHQEVEESLRVTYEDPGQRDEKRRLMRLLEKGEEDSDVEIVSVKTVEKSTVAAKATTRKKGRKSAT